MLSHWVSRPYTVFGVGQGYVMESRMHSLFRTVYLIETSLSVQNLVPAPPAASRLFVPAQRGKWPAVSLFKTVQLSKWQWHFHNASRGSSLFATPPTAWHCKPTPSLHSAPAGRCRLLIPKLVLYFTCHLTSLCLIVVLSLQFKTNQSSRF